jgi:hypothetical protein
MIVLGGNASTSELFVGLDELSSIRSQSVLQWLRADVSDGSHN